jgi:hypothetical protein
MITMRAGGRRLLVAAVVSVGLGVGPPPAALLAESTGNQIAYIANDRGSIHVVQADGSNDRPIVTAASIGDIAWSPDGATLAFTTTSPSQAAASQHIYLFNTVSGATTEVNSRTGTYGPIAFFPDGKHLAAVSNTRDPQVPVCRGGQALTLDVQTGTATPLVAAGCTVVGLQVTSDGATLISSDHGSNPPGHTWSTSLSSGDSSLLAHSGCDAFAVSDRSKPECSDSLAGDFNAGGITSAAVSRDNTTVVYVEFQDITNWGRNLVVAHPPATDARVVWQRAVDHVTIAPDASQIGVSVDPNAGEVVPAGDEEVWALGLDGSGAHKIAAGHEPAWRPTAGTVVASAPPNATQSQVGSVTTNCDAGRLVGQGVVAYQCDDGVYDLNPDRNSLYKPDPAQRPDAPLDGQQWPLTSEPYKIPPRWIDDQGRACELDEGDQGVQIRCTNGNPAPSVSSPSDTPDAAPATVDDASGPPTTLSAGVRADILAAVDRANTAWTTASHTVDRGALDGNVGGAELSDDLADLDKLQQLGQSRDNVQQAFTVTGVTLDAPGLATVHTHETWSSATHSSSGQVIQRTPPTTYDETYRVEYQNGGWIVTKNDI